MDTWGLLFVRSAMYPYMSKLSKAVLTRCVFFLETNSRRTWKWMVGRRSLPFGARPPGYVVWNPRFYCQCRGARFGIANFQGEFFFTTCWCCVLPPPPPTKKSWDVLFFFLFSPGFFRGILAESLHEEKQLQEQGSLNYLFWGGSNNANIG